MFFSFPPTLCWNFSAGNMNFHKVSLIVGDWPRQYFPGDSRLQPRRAGARHRPHPELRSVCLLLNRHKARLLPGPLAFGAGSQSSPKGTSVHGWMPNCYGCGGGGGTKLRDLLFSLIADVTQKPRSVILMEVPPQGNNKVGKWVSLANNEDKTLLISKRSTKSVFSFLYSFCFHNSQHSLFFLHNWPLLYQYSTSLASPHPAEKERKEKMSCPILFLVSSFSRSLPAESLAPI